MNTNEIFNQMLSSYDITTELQKRNAIFEVNQQIILSGLYNGGFFNEAAFYGGTCLRIFHGLHRFSEDMDFSLLAPNEKDTQPPLKFQTEQKLLLLPQSFMTRCFTLPALFAGKMHALVYRAWKNRVKGRDWYDFEWYVRHNVPLDFTHLCERALQFNHEELDKETFLQKLNERLATADMNQIKADVLPFVRNPKELDIWSNDYFMELAKMIRFE